MSQPLHLWLIHPKPEPRQAFDTRFRDLPHVSVHQSRFEDLPAHDCFVTAGNSYGMMTAGIDAAVVRFFGLEIMQSVQHVIMDRYIGEQPVGTAFLLPTGHSKIPFLCHAPTMRVPGCIERTDKVYQATWAALLAVHNHNTVSDHKIESLAFPSLGTGFGGMSFDESARQMATAYRLYLNPPHRLDWDWVIHREKAICYDDQKRVL